MTADLDRLGAFDVVLYLGVLYHIKEPLTALTRLRTVTTRLAVIETAAIELPGQDTRPLIEFDGDGRVNGDTTNWFFPTEAALHGLLRSAGFSSSETVARSSFDYRRPGTTDYRLTVHARP
jgi:tRNA (mo5U34)-methyltransferase